MHMTEAGILQTSLRYRIRCCANHHNDTAIGAMLLHRIYVVYAQATCSNEHMSCESCKLDMVDLVCKYLAQFAEEGLKVARTNITPSEI